MLLALLSACRHKHSDDVLARVYDHYLYAEDVVGLVGEGVSPEDSAAIIGNYINQWVQQMVVVEKARKNVRNDFSKELADFKNSLITYEYERLVIQQMLDTSVSLSQMQQYYNDHQSSFILKNSIVRAIYLKVPKASPNVVKIRALFAKPSLSDEDLSQLHQLATAASDVVHLDAESWIDFHLLQSEVPIETYNEAVFLRTTKRTELSVGDFVFFLRILDYKFQDDVSPFENEYDNIRTIILNARKIDIIKNMQRQLLEKASADKEIEIL